MLKSIDIKKKRQTNFSAKEEQQLILLVKKYANIIENKKTDSEMNRKKNAIWQQLSNEFNGHLGEPFRSVETLKNKYLNLKKMSKKKFADEKKYTYGTGGGPAINCTDSSIDLDIRQMIGSQMTGFDSTLDSDAPDLGDEKITFVIENGDGDVDMNYTNLFEENSVESEENVLVSIDSQQKDWTKQSVDNLRTPMSEKLKSQENVGTRKRDNFLKTKLGDWAKQKQETLNIHQQCIFDENKLKLKQSEEKHTEEMRQTRETHEQAMRMRQEEHDMKMSILKLEKQKLLSDLSK